MLKQIIVADRLINEQVFLHQRLKEALYYQNFKHGTFYEFLSNLIIREPETFVHRRYFELLVIIKIVQFY